MFENCLLWEIGRAYGLFPIALSGNLTYTKHINQKGATANKKCWNKVSKGYVPGITYLAVNEENRLVGMLNLRFRLNEYLLQYGGHIGYSVRKSERRKGYATEMLALALDEARKLDLKRVLITCDKENIGSAKTIQNNGGILENEVAEGDGITQRYWIAL